MRHTDVARDGRGADGRGDGVAAAGQWPPPACWRRGWAAMATWLDEAAMAVRLRVSRRTLRRWRRLGLPVAMVGRVVRLDAEAVDAWLAEANAPAALVGAAAQAATRGVGPSRKRGRPRRRVAPGGGAR